MKLILPFLVMLSLAGCATTQPELIVQQHTVVQIPSRLINCPKADLPDQFTSNKDVAKYLVKSHHNNVRCRDSIDKLVKYYQDAQTTVK
jgi:uncharacterized protein YcfL